VGYNPEDTLTGPVPTPLSHRLRIEILEQPTETTCGPTALHAVYRYLGDEVDLDQLVTEVPSVHNGGTLAVMLGCHALRRGYQARLYTYNLTMFDPTWFRPRRVELAERLVEQAQHKSDARLQEATRAYLEFLELGGSIRYEELTEALLQGLLARDLPVLTGLSATYLYRSARERPWDDYPDDVAGQPVGHFVVLSGYDSEKRTILVSDPWGKNPLSKSRQYNISIERVLGAVFLGALTYDANLLLIRPRRPLSRGYGVHPHRRK
jgi:hypothetical protein